ncbi:MAG: ChaN family lipoprotein [Cecembia sp.]
MIRHLICTALSLSLSFSTIGQTIAFKVFDKAGKEVSFDDLAQEATQQTLVFFGELHNNGIAHWLQLRLFKAMHASIENMVLAGEFFEKDDQLNIEEWFEGRITDKNFEAEAKLWNNYQTDYKPLMLYAKANGIPFIASNVPRKYASLVSREGLAGLESLSDEAKRYIAPLPVSVDKELPGYKAMADMMHGSPMNMDFMVEAQAIKDATMAASLMEHIRKGTPILHINGSYHSNNYEGIVWYIRQEFPELSLLTINTVEQENMHDLEEKYQGTADYIIVTPLDGPKSY